MHKFLIYYTFVNNTNSNISLYRHSQDNKKNSDEFETPKRQSSPARQSYVLKLFDRSVDLSQFEENTPLYPICRAWMINQPKARYKHLG